MKDKILSDFLVVKKTLDSYRERAENLLVDLLKQDGIIIHHISSRTKDYNSLSRKIDRKFEKYSSLDGITDLVGIRIISYLESDVDVIAGLVSKEFLVDPDNSVDRRKLNADQFGYKSLHLVVNLSESRTNLTEYQNYKNLKCEIQIRSILQHAWAEIEHDLGYKGKSAIPDQYKRNFNRLAALLETADLEFVRLKRELSEYESEVGELIKKTPEDVKIDQASLTQFSIENVILQEARDLMSSITGWIYAEELNNLNGITERFEFFGMKTIKDIEDALIKDKDVFFKYLKNFTKDLKQTKISVTIPLFYYQHFLAGKTGNLSKVAEYQNWSGTPLGGSPEVYIELYKKAKNEKK